MGCIQCLEEHDLLCVDNQASRHMQFNLSNVDPEELPILTENDEENTETRQSRKNIFTRHQSQKAYNTSNKQTKEVLTHYKTISEDDSVFKTIPKSSRNLINQIDYYNLSRKVFDSLNDVRIKPESYQSLFSNLDETCDSKLRTIKDIIIEECNRNTTNTPNGNANEKIELIQQHLAQNKRGSVILWNEMIYSAISSYITDSNQKADSEELSRQVCSKLNGNYSCVGVDIVGAYTSDNCFWNLIYNNTDRLKELCVDRYHSGAICCSPMRTVLVLINKVNDNINDKEFETNMNMNVNINVGISNDSNDMNKQQQDVIVFNNNQMINELLDEEQMNANDFLSESNSMLFQFANESARK